jgi:BirA family biotin operon repressor/biotin-[acetyl-CoA-carboxylase] ligase
MVTRMAGTDASRSPGSVPTERLAATRFRVDWVPTTGSTNADLLVAAAAGAPDGAVVVTDHQTAGRGRRGRTWEAPPGASLLMSVLLRPDISPERASALTAAMGLAARQACLSVAGVRAGLKWPNDLVAATTAGERKLGGILAESRVVADRVEAVVVGLGLNVTWPEPLPEELAGIAVALNHLRPEAEDIDRADLVVTILTDLEGRLRSIERGDAAAVWAAWRDRTATLGRDVRVETADGTITGRAEDVTDLGRLVLRLDEGSRVEVDVGDVVHLRAEGSSG